MTTPARRTQPKFKPTQKQLDYALAYVRDPSLKRSQVARAAGTTKPKVDQWYSDPAFLQWLYDETHAQLRRHISMAAHKRVLEDIGASGAAGSRAALAILLEDLKHANALERASQTPAPVAASVIIAIGSAPVTGVQLHPAAQLVEAQVQENQQAQAEAGE